MGNSISLTKERNTSIDILKIISMLMVVVLHYNNYDIGGGLKYVAPGSLNYYMLNFMESLCILAVNVFILITGYFLVQSNKRSLLKPIKLLVQVSVFSVAYYSISVLIGQQDFQIKYFLFSFLPKGWFCLLYVVLYVLSPVLNLIVEKLSQKSLKLLLILMLVIFSVWPSIHQMLESFAGASISGLSSVGIYGAQSGYTIVQFVFLYLIGAYLRTYPIQTKSWILTLTFFINLAVLTVWALFEGTAWAYCNPLVITNAVLLLILFSRIKIKSCKIVSLFASASFTVYLTHNYFLPLFKIPEIVNMNVAIVILHLLGVVVACYLLAFIIHYVYNFITNPIFKWLEKKIKLPTISFEEKQVQLDNENRED